MLIKVKDPSTAWPIHSVAPLSGLEPWTVFFALCLLTAYVMQAGVMRFCHGDFLPVMDCPWNNKPNKPLLPELLLLRYFM